MLTGDVWGRENESNVLRGPEGRGHSPPGPAPTERKELACLNAKEGTCPGSGYRIRTDTAGVKVPCATVTQNRRVAGFPRRARKIMNTKAKRIVVPVFPGCQLYRWGMPVFPGCQLIYTCPLPNALKHHKEEELCLLLHVQHSFRFDYDTRYSPSRHHSGTV